MDVATEPIIVVIGHPIAGNPSQFAVERALRSLDLDWRVLSFDVDPSDVATALEGFAVTGITGVMVGSSLWDAATGWYDRQPTRQHSTSVGVVSDDDASDDDASDDDASDDDASDDDASDDDASDDDASDDDASDSDSESTLQVTATEEVAGNSSQQAVDANHDPTFLIDCLSRDSNGRFVGSNEQRRWIKERIAEHPRETRLLIGDALPQWMSGDVVDKVTVPPNPASIAAARLILISEEVQDEPLECEDWGTATDSTTVIDLTDGHPEVSVMQRLGYQVTGAMDRKIATLQRCLALWTGKQVSGEVLHEAIEEYLGV